MGGNRGQLRQRARDIGVKRPASGQVRRLHPQQIFDIARDIVAFAHFRHPRDSSRNLCFGCPGRLPMPPREADAKGKPLAFLQAVAFQLVNPRAIYRAIAAQTCCAPEGSGWTGAFLVAPVFS